MTLLQAKTCPTTYSSETWSESDYSSRRAQGPQRGFLGFHWDELTKVPKLGQLETTGLQ